MFESYTWLLQQRAGRPAAQGGDEGKDQGEAARGWSQTKAEVRPRRPLGR